MEPVKESISAICKKLFSVDATPEITRPAEQFGDFSTNVALTLAAKLGKNPREVANKISTELAAVSGIVSAEVAGPGFINIALEDSTLITAIKSAVDGDSNFGRSKALDNQTVVVEYSDPNPFKVLHAGHLYTSVVGDAIANLLEASGARVHRVNYGGDVGRHVAITLWAMLQKLGGEYPQKLDEIDEHARAEWMAECYIEGTSAYDTNPKAKAEITDLNKRVYEFHAKNDQDSPLAKIYWTTRSWSYEYFEYFYSQIGTKFEKFYPESDVAELGIATVREQLGKGVFQESDGAVVFDGDKHGLHTRVFINSQGLPTYEAKEVGLIKQKAKDYDFDKSVVITGSEQEQYMAVVLKAVEQFLPDLAQKTTHLTHGMVKLLGGVKMSSRKGNILRALDVIDAAAEANRSMTGKDNDDVALGAVKYSFLKQRLGPDVVYDPEESVSLTGNSGPYLQYALVRAKSIWRNAPSNVVCSIESSHVLQPAERSLIRKIGEYPEVIEKASAELLPHHLATYLYELCQEFNRFYEQSRIIGDEREEPRLAMLAAYKHVLNNGLLLLGIPIVEQM